MTERKNTNRGCMKLTVWQDARSYYVLTCRIFRVFPYELKRAASQPIASVDPIHRNIAEGYGRRSLNGLKRLIESLQLKRETGGWKDSFIIRESNTVYGTKT